MPETRVERTALYSLHHPNVETLPVLVNSPHSGEAFPGEFLARSQLGRDALRRASDLFVNDLVTPLAGQGAFVMEAHLPRSFVDLNREPFELDPRLIIGPLPVEANSRSLRVAGGLGTVPRVIGDQIEIYAGKITLAEALSRVEHFYIPYHRRLHALMQEISDRHGEAVLIDCHSMPSQPAGRSAHGMPDLIIGDRFGSSAAPDLVDEIEAAARQVGFRVERNQPYAGGYITEHYGNPGSRRHAVQIEINRAIYMDEATLRPHEGFGAVREALYRLFALFFGSAAFQKRTSDLQFYQRAAE